ncbi:MAG: hypothetical protein KG075_21965, partial [Alphaproteobacteria bacterium]|nr:hypothetical protein [Alphaproteobacteria bacterium]
RIEKSWMAGTSPAMTIEKDIRQRNSVMPGLDPGIHLLKGFVHDAALEEPARRVELGRVRRR